MALSDLEVLVQRCRSPRARSYLVEAVSCYHSTAYRAAIVMTWLAVVVDIISKLEELAMGGDASARTWAERLADIVARQDTTQALQMEQSILEVARDKFELVGKLEWMDLERLREDRHRCAHPSMLDPATDYRLSAESVRYHIASAVTHLLGNGPAQGKAALDRLLSDFDSPLFPTTVEGVVVHLRSGPLGRARVALVRNYVVVVLKELLGAAPELSGNQFEKWQGGMKHLERLQRMNLAILATATLYRQNVLDVVSEKLEELAARLPDGRLTTLLILCSGLPEAWSTLSAGQKQRLSLFVQSARNDSLAVALHAAAEIGDLSMTLRGKLASLVGGDWDALAQYPYVLPGWIELAVARIEAAAGWSDANAVKTFLVAKAQFLSEPQVRRILTAAAANADVRTSWGVQDTLHAIGSTSTFGPQRVKQLIEEAGLTASYEGEHWFKTLKV